MEIPVQCERKKTLHVNDEFVSSIREACNWKKAERLPENSYYKLYVGDDILNEMISSDHQLIWGRRGTGKTHLLKAFTQKINSDSDSRSMAFYISCDMYEYEIDIGFMNSYEPYYFCAGTKA